MPTLIRCENGAFAAAEDPFTRVADDQELPQGDVIISLQRFLNDGERLIGQHRAVGVVLKSSEEVAALSIDLAKVAVVALDFPAFRDGRAYTQARLLRERYGFEGEVRAVGDVLREQVGFMLRCGFDAFEPADGASCEDLAMAARRQRHVYQRAADGRRPAFAEREA